MLNLNFQKDVSLANDDFLGDLMEELHQGPADGMMKPLPIKLKKKGFSATKSVLNVWCWNSFESVWLNCIAYLMDIVKELDFRCLVTHSVKKERKKEPIQIHFSFCSISVVFNFFKNKKNNLQNSFNFAPFMKISLESIQHQHTIIRSTACEKETNNQDGATSSPHQVGTSFSTKTQHPWPWGQFWWGRWNGHGDGTSSEARNCRGLPTVIWMSRYDLCKVNYG